MRKACPKSILKEVKSGLGARNIRVTGTAEGYNNNIYFINADGRQLALKVTKSDRLKIHNEVFALRKWHDLGVPVPEIVLADRRNRYCVETRMPGMPLGRAHLTGAQTAKVMAELGRHIRKMHSVKMKRFGYLDRNGIGTKSSWERFVSPDFNGCMKAMREKEVVRYDEMRRIDRFHERYKPLINLRQGRLVHSDLTLDNIMVKDGRLSGIIDASDAMSGDPEFDLAYTYAALYPKVGPFMSLVRGYGGVDMRKVRLYFVWIVLYWIIKDVDDKRSRKYFRRNLRRLRHFMVHET